MMITQINLAFLLAKNGSAILKNSVSIFFIILLANVTLIAQNQVMSTGSYIINMGITPQTVDNGLKPHGMIYDLIKNYSVPIKWCINTSKLKDGIDFTHNNIEYRGGPFIIPFEFRTPAVNARIAYWETQGVIGATTISQINVPIYQTIYAVPRWTLDLKHGAIAEQYFINAGIPETAYGGGSKKTWKDPEQLNCCDDLFVMPHADPIWETHQNLYYWNQSCKGGIWSACHGVSTLENMVNPLDRSEQTNFLTKKDNNFTGTSGNYANSNSLLLWPDHVDGRAPYDYRLPGDPVAQFMGTADAAMNTGSEQIYVPRQSSGTTSRWNPSINMLVYDADQNNVLNPNLTDFRNVAGLMMYGRGFENPDRGMVMYEAGHSHNNAKPSAIVAAQRAFFNFGIIVTNDKVVVPDLSSMPSTMTSATSYAISFSLPDGINSADYTIEWKSSCGGSFSPNANQQNVTFTPPIVNAPTNCNISVTITDACGRVVFNSKSILINKCTLIIDRSVSDPTCTGFSNGVINMSISGSTGPFTWTWTKLNSAATGSGSGVIIPNLSSGTYTVKVLSANGCEGEFNQLLSEPTQLMVSETSTNYLCPGSFGTISLNVNGGTGAYTFNWSDLPGTNDPKNRSGLLSSNYSVVVKDQNDCQVNKSIVITGPKDNIQVQLLTKTNVTCNGYNDGSMTLNVSGGTGPYTYQWNDGNTNLNRSALLAGQYDLAVTDANGCVFNATQIIAQPNKITLSYLVQQPTCPESLDSFFPKDGQINLIVSGGVPPYVYDWADLISPLEPEDRSGLAAGTYAVQVRDQNICTANTSVVLTPLNSNPTPPSSINRN